MKNSSLIIKIAVIVSAIASVFSVVTLIRAIIIKSNIVFPIIQVVGSLAICAVCFFLFRTISKTEDEEETDEEETSDEINDDDNGAAKAEKDVDDLYEKYRLSEFEDKKDEQSDKSVDDDLKQ